MADLPLNYGSWIHTNQFLTNLLLGYKLANPVADFVSPGFLVTRPSDKYGKYNKSINIIYDDEVSGNEEPQEIDYQVDQVDFSCTERHLAKGVYWRAKRMTDSPWNLDYDAIRFLKRALTISREYKVAKIFASTGFYSANHVKDNSTGGSYSWQNVNGTPLDDCLNAMSQIVTDTGGYQANRIVIPTNVALAMVKTTNWKDSFKWSSMGFGNGLFSVADGLKNLGLEPMLTAVQGTTSMSTVGSDPGMATIWGNNVLIFYCEPNPSLETRTLSYSPYTLDNVIETIPQKLKKRDLHTIYAEKIELGVDFQCGYLLQNNN